jgi:hypothetical protein
MRLIKISCVDRNIGKRGGAVSQEAGGMSGTLDLADRGLSHARRSEEVAL